MTKRNYVLAFFIIVATILLSEIMGEMLKFLFVLTTITAVMYIMAKPK